MCKDFRNLDPAAAIDLITRILREHPGSKFDANPSAAIATAKLACMSSSYADTSVASAAGITQ
ncbi:hypothetical protein EBN03_08300 [Nocardia stercoris]|uniref:DUF732 domain-containing protein n=1 Tax=Nocardia stercoris TaxID=2483361 RepID=A0A3M2LCS1_9NOCA|nr:hypothetical protein EBN03_08300 [Nocardia stercoris]